MVFCGGLYRQKTLQRLWAVRRLLSQEGFRDLVRGESEGLYRRLSRERRKLRSMRPLRKNLPRPGYTGRRLGKITGEVQERLPTSGYQILPIIMYNVINLMYNI